MTTEELIRETAAPLKLELDYATDVDTLFGSPSTTEAKQTPHRRHEDGKQETKKNQIIRLYEHGTTDIAEIVRLTGVRPSYAAQVLQREGFLSGYFDLYTTTGREHNVYGRFFRNVLQFKTAEAARASIEKIDKLYNYFERLGDRAGQHQACVIALTGKNRARWSGKHEAAAIFSEWLAAH